MYMYIPKCIYINICLTRAHAHIYQLIHRLHSARPSEVPQIYTYMYIQCTHTSRFAASAKLAPHVSTYIQMYLYMYIYIYIYIYTYICMHVYTYVCTTHTHTLATYTCINIYTTHAYIYTTHTHTHTSGLTASTWPA